MNLTGFSVGDLLRKRRQLNREMSAAGDLRDIRIAVLGGTTTDELVALWELTLLASGFRPTFFQSDYGQFYEVAVLDQSALLSFRPNLVYVHTCYRNVLHMPRIGADEAEFETCLRQEAERYSAIWHSLQNALTCQIVQNNFDAPPYRTLGHLDTSAPGGSRRFLLALNTEFARIIRKNKGILLHDLHALQTELGSQAWFDWRRWFSYKLLYSSEAYREIALSLTAVIGAIYGISRKVLVLDLDNTCWGGVIGDDGVEKIEIGRETPVAEAFTEFQEYCLRMRERGILLAVCSKNDEEIAKQGFCHPDSVLKLEHISSFKANWRPKHENIVQIAQELNVGIDSLVFVDDNPAERAIVSGYLPNVAVPDLGSDPSSYPRILDAGRYFEPVSISAEDLERAQLYQKELERSSSVAAFTNYGDYLDSLEMKAEIAAFVPTYLDRIVQLINKTNQFNLTTKRYTLAEVDAMVKDPAYLTLYGKLSDRFGDSGLVSVVVGYQQDRELRIDLWLMSCRVLKRSMEFAMLDALVERARLRGVQRLIGSYVPSKKNAMVIDHYERLGFDNVARDEVNGVTEFCLNLEDYVPLESHMSVMEVVHG